MHLLEHDRSNIFSKPCFQKNNKYTNKQLKCQTLPLCIGSHLCHTANPNTVNGLAKINIRCRNKKVMMFFFVFFPEKINK